MEPPASDPRGYRAEMPFNYPEAETLGLVVALIAPTIALFVLASNWRNRVNQAFALFLFFVAGNFAANFIGLGFPDQSGLRQAWLVAGWVFLALDPAALVYFASVFPRRSLFAQHQLAMLGLLLTALFFVGLVLFRADRFVGYPGIPWEKTLLIFYMAIGYLYCLGILLLRDPGPPERALTRQANFLMLGFSVALLPRFGLVLDDLQIVSTENASLRLLPRILVMWGMFLAFWSLSYLLTRRDPEHRRRGYQTRWVANWTVLFLAIITLAYWLGAILEDRYGGEAGFQLQFYFPVRWVLFGLIVSYAILRYETFDLEVRLKRGLRYVLPLLLGFGLFLAAYAAFQTLPASALKSPTMGAAVAVIISVAAALALWKVAQRVTDILMPRVTTDALYLRGRKLEVYGAHLERAALQGKLTVAPTSELDDVRRELGISLEEHAALERLLRRITTPPRLEDRIATGEPLFGRYRVLRRLDAGGFADVFLAHDAQQGRSVVLKRLHPRYGQDERVLRSFLREAEVAGRVRHPNIVPVHEVLRDGADIYLVVEFVEGGSLSDRLKTGTPMPVPEAVAIVRDILMGLQAAHALHVFHRDLKPSNVLLSPDGQARLTDFGVAHVPSLEDTAMGFTAPASQPGTIAYMAPEQALGRPVDGRADVYGAGALLYELLTGKPLFDPAGLGEFELRQRVARGVAAARLRDAPATVRPILAKALARDPAKRYSTPADFQQALEKIASLPT